MLRNILTTSVIVVAFAAAIPTHSHASERQREYCKAHAQAYGWTHRKADVCFGARSLDEARFLVHPAHKRDLQPEKFEETPELSTAIQNSAETPGHNPCNVALQMTIVNIFDTACRNYKVTGMLAVLAAETFRRSNNPNPIQRCLPAVALELNASLNLSVRYYGNTDHWCDLVYWGLQQDRAPWVALIKRHR